MTALRLAGETDAEAIAGIYAPYVRDTAITFELDPPSADEMRGRLRDTLERWPWLVAEDGGVVAGYAYGCAHRARAAYRWSVDVSVYLAASHHRRGIGRGLYRALLAILRAQGFHNAYSGITLPNAASVGLHEAMGFRAVGVYRHVGWKHGAWHDVGWWHLVLREPVAAPAEPLLLSDVRRTGAWEAAMGGEV